MKIKLEFDPRNFKVGAVTHKLWETVRFLLLFFLVTLSLTVVVYLLASFLFSTGEEKKLAAINREYSENYHLMMPMEDSLKDAITIIQHKDNEIYSKVFDSEAPNVDPMNSLDYFFASDTIPDEKLVSYARDKSDRILEQAGRVDRAFARIAWYLGREGMILPPMRIPVEGISYPQMGASTGQKVNPFYGTYVFHRGADFLVLRGTPVLASADAVVESVTNSKSSGLTVTLGHAGEYETGYSHLESSLVKKGDVVAGGQQIGTAGMSGKAFAPHLHYEILKNGNPVDPVNYLFASVGPDEYANMLYMSVNTMQSMD